MRTLLLALVDLIRQQSRHYGNCWSYGNITRVLRITNSLTPRCVLFHPTPRLHTDIKEKGQPEPMTRMQLNEYTKTAQTLLISCTPPKGQPRSHNDQPSHFYLPDRLKISWLSMHLIKFLFGLPRVYWRVSVIDDLIRVCLRKDY